MQCGVNYVHALCLVISIFTHSWLILTDINECELETYPCSLNANCTDTDGSFNCTCREGFEGDGFNCTGRRLHKHCLLLWWLFNALLQTFQSVKEVWTVVIQMQLVKTQLEVMTVCATLALLEMDLHVQVSKQMYSKLCTALEAVKQDCTILHNYLTVCMPLCFL